MEGRGSRQEPVDESAHIIMACEGPLGRDRADPIAAQLPDVQANDAVLVQLFDKRGRWRVGEKFQLHRGQGRRGRPEEQKSPDIPTRVEKEYVDIGGDCVPAEPYVDATARDERGPRVVGGELNVSLQTLPGVGRLGRGEQFDRRSC